MLCVLLAALAPVEARKNLLMPQNRAALYHTFDDLRAAVCGFPANLPVGNMLLT